MIGWSWGAFIVYVAALVLMTLGGFFGLIESGYRVFLVPVLMGLFFFYITWTIVVEDNDGPPPTSKQR